MCQRTESLQASTNATHGTIHWWKRRIGRNESPKFIWKTHAERSFQRARQKKSDFSPVLVPAGPDRMFWLPVIEWVVVGLALAKLFVYELFWLLSSRTRIWRSLSSIGFTHCLSPSRCTATIPDCFDRSLNRASALLQVERFHSSLPVIVWTELQPSWLLVS